MLELYVHNKRELLAKDVEKDDKYIQMSVSKTCLSKLRINVILILIEIFAIMW